LAYARYLQEPPPKARQVSDLSRATRRDDATLSRTFLGGAEMNLGQFSISLAVKDIRKSKAFYGALGFIDMGGNIEQNWCILKQGDIILGLFQGVFEKNMLTFNPGWDANAQNLDVFDDVRTLQKRLKENGIELTEECDEAGTGPAHFTLIDPDGNPILVDQHR
jgi:lactoylglutathione lyase